MRASGWPSEICGSNVSGSEPETYRRMLLCGGSVLPKNTLLADAAQPALIRASAKTRTGIKSEQEPLKNSLSPDCRTAVPIVAFKLALAPDLSNRASSDRVKFMRWPDFAIPER